MKTILWRNKLEYPRDKILCLTKAAAPKEGDFAPISRAKLEKIKTKLVQLGAGNTFNTAQIIATHQLATTQLGFYSASKLQKVPPAVISSLTVDNLLSVSKKFNIPPLTLVKAKLRLSTSKAELHRWTSDPNAAPPNVTPFITKAFRYDSETPAAYLERAKQAFDYELLIEKWLKSKKIEFKTQAQLVEEQTKLYGRAVITPDFLLTSPLKFRVVHPDSSVSESKVYWIDVKNYIYTGSKFITNSLQTQSAKYVKAFGPGAFLFHYGFVDDIAFNETINLSHPT
jgi:Protein of unknown function TPD sequence-motif